MSTDSRVPMDDRIYEFLSDGVEIITSTDHNVVADYAPIIQELGVGKDITSIVGDEMTTGAWGHFGRTATRGFKDVRDNAPGAIIDVHHPRIDSEIGYFNLARFDPIRDHAEKPGFSYDFDAIEVLNGYQDPERCRVDRLINARRVSVQTAGRERALQLHETPKIVCPTGIPIVAGRSTISGIV